MTYWQMLSGAFRPHTSMKSHNSLRALLDVCDFHTSLWPESSK